MPALFLYVSLTILTVSVAVFLTLYLRSYLRTKALELLLQERDERVSALENDLNGRTAEQKALQVQLQALADEKNTLERDYAILHTRFDDATSAHNEKIKLLDEAKETLKQQFNHLANEIFENKTKRFEESSQERLQLLLKPFREQISHFSKQTEERFVKENSERAVLHKELSRLRELNEQITQDAQNLTSALKGENKTQGNWGEIVLERILEESGLRKGFEYVTQGSFKDGGGKTMRPDVIVHLPQNKDIVIDSKVSLVAYERFMSAETPQEREHALKQHLNSINAHIKGLSEKRYEKLDGVRTLDFILLFMPIEGAFLLALEQDSTFFSRAYEANIMIVSPSTLLVTLRTIEHIWRTERQEQNAQEIARQAEALYDKFAAFVEDLTKIGDQIAKTNESYEKALNKLSTGKGNLLRRVESIKQLGLKPKKKLQLVGDGDES
ncbi:DNA recombination protein RmuC [Sulfurimonas sp. HSL3-7]|uniref:DNA recombination protein RmuC n=1 Tax=Sulfonitrofixus jiaomeiensis TaxID=3131938 RepID=UPI0031F7F1AF